MNILDRYLLRVISRSSIMVMLVLLALSGFINLVDQLEDVGVGRFGTTDAFFMVLFLWPRHAFEMFPMAVLMGSMFGLGALANHSELIAIRAAGVSLARLVWAALLTGMILAVFAALIGEFVVPPAERFAQTYKAELEQEENAISRLAGAWFRDGPRIVNILQVQGETRLSGVYTYEFEPNGRLLAVGRAPVGELDGEHGLLLRDYVMTKVEGDVASVENVGMARIETELAADLLESSVIEPESMSAGSLVEYIHYLKDNDLQSVRYELALWGRFSTLAAVALMGVLAIPFVFGTLRSGSQGVRLLIGVLVGAIFFLAGGALADSATVYGVPPVAAAWIPIGLLLTAIGIGLARVR